MFFLYARRKLRNLHGGSGHVGSPQTEFLCSRFIETEKYLLITNTLFDFDYMQMILCIYFRKIQWITYSLYILV